MSLEDASQLMFKIYLNHCDAGMVTNYKNVNIITIFKKTLADSIISCKSKLCHLTTIFDDQ